MQLIIIYILISIILLIKLNIMEAAKYFKNKRIFVTGGGQGIGNHLCKTLYSHGAKVIATTTTKEKSSELKAACPNIETIIVNLSNWNATREALKGVDCLDGLVNNAGVAIIKPFSELTEDDYEKTFNVNVKAVFNVSQILVPKMKNGSSIVNVSSVASLTAFQDHSIYCATKAAVDALTRNMALELGTRNIRVNTVNPTVVLTDMGRQNWSEPKKANQLLNRIPLGRFCELDEAIEPILYLLSSQSSFINGHHLPVEGGYLAA